MFDINGILKSINIRDDSVESLEKSEKIKQCINDVVNCMTSHLKR
jgi:hypothetical protein